MTLSQNPNQQPAKKIFNPSEVRRKYTDKEWQLKEDWYTQQVNNIGIPPSPSVTDIQDIASRIDTLLTIARLDYAYVNQNFDKYNMNMKIEEKRLFVELKLNPPQQYQGLKFTVDEMKGVVSSVLRNNKWDNGQYTLYELVQNSSARNIFMETVIKALSDKKDLLITHSGMLKIEHSLDGMTARVPKGNGGVPDGM